MYSECGLHGYISFGLVWNQWPSPQHSSSSTRYLPFSGPEGWLLNNQLCGCYQLGWIWTFQRKTKWHSGYLFTYKKLFIVTNIYHLTVSVGQEPGHNLVGPPVLSLTAAIQVPARPQSPQPDAGRTCSQVDTEECWQELISSWTVGPRTSVSCWLSVGGFPQFLARWPSF